MPRIDGSPGVEREQQYSDGWRATIAAIFLQGKGLFRKDTLGQARNMPEEIGKGQVFLLHRVYSC